MTPPAGERGHRIVGRPGAARRPGSGHPVWIGFLAALLVVELCLGLADRDLIGSLRWRPLAYQNGAFWTGLLAGWTPNFALQPVTMFLSYAFLHVGAGHLLGNAAALIWLGQTLGGRTGPARFAALILAVVLGGALGYALLAREPTPMVGASGAVMGLVGIWIVWEARDMAAAGFSRRRIATGAAVRTAIVLLANAGSFVALGGVLAWEAHLGGFVCGIGAGILLSARRRTSPPA